MSAKEYLKAARNAIHDEDYQEALENCNEVLKRDAESYFGYVLKGKALQMLGRYDESRKAYEGAIKSNEAEPTAWKGLRSLYDVTNNAGGMIDVACGLAHCASERMQEAEAACKAFKHAVRLTKTTDDLDAKIRLLEVQLEDSTLRPTISRVLLEPDVALRRLIKLLETTETEAINRTVAKHKFRVGVKADAVQLSVFEIRSKSLLPKYYNVLINTTMDDEERRNAEGKLFEHQYDLLLREPVNKKKEEFNLKIHELAEDMLVVDSPTALAWKLCLDWADVDELKDLDYNLLLRYVTKFPRAGLARVLDAFLHSEISPFAKIKEEATAKGKGKSKDSSRAASKSPESSVEPSPAPETEYDEIPTPETEDVMPSSELDPATILELMTEGFDADTDAILSCRILGAYYLRLQEYETAADIANKGLANIRSVTASTRVQFPNSKNHLSVILGTAYIYYQAPKNFDAAITAFNAVLGKNPENIDANIGKGLILREKHEYQGALKLLEKVQRKNPDNFVALFEVSWCRILMNQFEEGRKGLEKGLEMVVGDTLMAADYRAQSWWRIGVSWSEQQGTVEGEERTEMNKRAFSAYVQSLQENPNLAAAYTSLGFFYLQEGDNARASKCFYKAFELDSGEIEAARQLATEFANESQWDLVEVVASRVVGSDRLRTYSKDEDSSWPYRSLGIVALNQHDNAKASQNFQMCLRITPKDANAWTGLGEAYYNSGRFVAATKAYERARLLDPDNLYIRFQQAVVLRSLHEFTQAVEHLEELKKVQISLSRYDIPTTLALIESHLMASRYLMERDFYGDASQHAASAMSVACQDIQDQTAGGQGVWQGLGEACGILLELGSHMNVVPVNELTKVVGAVEGDPGSRDWVTQCMIFAFERALSECNSAAHKGTAYYNIGLAYQRAYGTTGEADSSFQMLAVENFKLAIQAEPRNSDFWNAYGVASESLNARVSQHCFIRSLSLNARQPRTWTNLALLYIGAGDFELASEAVEKAQAVDPDFVSAWICQAVIESTLGRPANAANLFEHSYKISKGGDGLARFLYGISVLEQAKSNGGAVQLETGVLALQRYLRLSPESEQALQSLGMLLEREASFGLGVEYVTQLCTLLESQYQEAESQDVLVKFCQGKCLLARLHLGAKEFEAAVEDAEGIINIISQAVADEDVGPLEKTLLSAYLTAGIGSYFAKKFDEAIDFFRQALQVSSEHQDVVILLVQVLWAHGASDDEKDIARDQLYSSVAEKGASTSITLLMGVIGLLDSSEDLLTAAGEELEKTPYSELIRDHAIHPVENSHRIQEVLSLVQNEPEPWRRAAVVWPDSAAVWQNIHEPTALSLAWASRAEPQFISSLLPRASGSIEAANRAVFLSPWDAKSWDSLVEALA